MATKWGIVSAGYISHDFTTCLRSMSSEEHKVVAIAARSKERASEFAAKHNIPTAYGSYEELAKDPNVEIVYIGSINTEHYAIGKMMIEHKKAVLIEKPLGMNMTEAMELTSLAKKHEVFLMEAIWSRFVPAYVFIKEQIEAGVIGDIIQVHGTFGSAMQHRSRVFKKELGGSVVLDIGVYLINFVTFFNSGKSIKEIKAAGHLCEPDVDDNFSASMKFADGSLATIAASGTARFPNEGFIYGTKGTIKLAKPLHCPDQVTINDQTHDFPFPDTVMKVNFTNSSGLRYQAMEVRRCLQAKLTESPILPHKESVLIAGIEDDIRTQCGASVSDIVNP